MEVSVIGNPQSKIYRAELAYRELRFDVFSGELRNRVSFSTHQQSSKWKKEIKIRCSPRSVKCEAIVSDQAPFLKPTPKSRSPESVKLFVGLPLDTVSNCNSVNHLKAITAGLKALKLLGVEGVELPIFWGVVEKEAPGKYDWSGYLAVAEIVKNVGLKLHASLSFHGSKEISLPDWVAKIAEQGIYFTDRYGNQYKDCLSFAVDDVPVLDGKTPMEVYGGFCESFKSAFSDYLGSTVTGITLGLGPDGELKYPSHQQHETNQHLSGAGEFQCYDDFMLSSLKHYAESTGNPLWGLGGPHDAPAYDHQQPGSTSFFSDGGSWESRYGDFFLTWYSSLLASHAERVLSVASSAFSGSGVSLCGKLPLLHRWNKLRSRPSELTGGFHGSDGRDRYEAIAEIFAKNSCRMIIPGMDLSDEHQSPESLSSPESLLAHIKTSCKKQGVVVSGQNSSASVPGGFERIVENLKDESVGVVDLFTYQRMGAFFFSPEHFHAFTVFIRNMNQFELSSCDQAVEGDKAKTMSIGSGTTGAASLQTA